MAAHPGTPGYACAHLALSTTALVIDDELKAQILRYYFAEHWRVGTIARQLGVHHSTVERVLSQAGVEREHQRPRRPSMIDPYVAFITETLEQFPSLSAARLFDMVTERGYPGGPDHLRHRIAQLRPAVPARRICAFAPCPASRRRWTGRTLESSPSGAPSAP